MDWVHCNACAFQPGQQPKRNFKLTSCGHIFCHACELSASIEKCKMCAVQCTTTALSAEMATEVQAYFEDPETSLSKVVKVMEFQKSHRLRLNEYYRNMKEKYVSLKITLQEMEKENKSLKRELDAYKKNDSNIFLTPPQPAPGYPLFCRNSQASQAIRGMSKTGSALNGPSPFTPSPLNHCSPGYRIQNRTPQTPLSNASSTPSSAASTQSYRSNQSRRSYHELPHRLTKGLDLLSVGSQMPSASGSPPRLISTVTPLCLYHSSPPPGLVCVPHHPFTCRPDGAANGAMIREKSAGEDGDISQKLSWILKSQ